VNLSSTPPKLKNSAALGNKLVVLQPIHGFCLENLKANHEGFGWAGVPVPA